MVIPNAVVMLVSTGALLFLGKSWAHRCFYKDVARRRPCHSWHNDPSREFPDGH